MEDNKIDYKNNSKNIIFTTILYKAIQIWGRRTNKITKIEKKKIKNKKYPRIGFANKCLKHIPLISD